MKYLMCAFIGVFSFAAYAQTSDCDSCNSNVTRPNHNVGNLTDFSTPLYKMYEHILKNDLQETIEDAAKNVEQVKVPIKWVAFKNMDEVMKDLNWSSPDDAALFFVFRLPSAFSTRQQGRTGLSFEENSSNTMVHARELRGNDGKSRFQYIDGIGQTTTVKFELGTKTDEFSMSLRNYELIGQPKTLTAYAVQDENIEMFHEWKQKRSGGSSDPYWRKVVGYNSSDATLIDKNGNSLKISEHQQYLLPLVLTRGKFLELLSTDTTQATLNYGAQAGLPLSRSFGQASVGTYGNLSLTDQLTKRLFVHAAIGIGMSVNTNIYPDAYQPTDNKWDLAYNTNLALGISCLDKDNRGKTSLILSATSLSPLLNEKKYSRPAASERFVYKQSFDAATTKDKAFSLGIQREDLENGHYMKFECFEDFGNRSSKAKDDGNNNRDFSCNFLVGTRLK